MIPADILIIKSSQYTLRALVREIWKVLHYNSSQITTIIMYIVQLPS